MERIEKTVFISYRRRTNFPWALNVYQNLTYHGYDVFFDYEGVGPGDFESIILENVRARAHFLIVLTPSALERCAEPGDWLRREIEAALESKRNIVPLMIEGFDFDTPAIASQLTGKLAALRNCNGPGMPAEYFLAAMEKLRNKFLNVHLGAVKHPASASAQQAAAEQKAAANAAAPVREEELTAQQYFERAYASSDPNEEIRLYTEAIRLKADLPEAYYNRGIAHYAKSELDSAIEDYSRAIEIEPDHHEALVNRGIARKANGDLDGAFEDYSQAILLNPDYANAYFNRASILRSKDQHAAAIADFQRYLDMGGGVQDGDTKEVEEMISDLKKKL